MKPDPQWRTVRAISEAILRHLPKFPWTTEAQREFFAHAMAYVIVHAREEILELLEETEA